MKPGAMINPWAEISLRASLCLSRPMYRILPSEIPTPALNQGFPAPETIRPPLIRRSNSVIHCPAYKRILAAQFSLIQQSHCSNPPARCALQFDREADERESPINNLVKVCQVFDDWKACVSQHVMRRVNHVLRLIDGVVGCH